MYKPIFNKREVLVFRQFQRKGYSLFACLGREIVISVLSVATLSSASADDFKDKAALTDTTTALKEVWQDEYDAKIKVVEAENALRDAYKKREEAEQMLIPAQERLAKAQERVNQLNDKYADKLPYYKNNQKDYQDAVAELEHATKDLEIAEGQQSEALKEANKTIRECDIAVWKAKDTYDAAARKAEMGEQTQPESRTTQSPRFR